MGRKFPRLPATSKWKWFRVIGGFGCPEGSLTVSQWMTQRLSEGSRSLCALHIRLNQASAALLRLAGVPPESCCALCSRRGLIGLWLGVVYVHLAEPDKVWKKIMSSDPLFPPFSSITLISVSHFSFDVPRQHHSRWYTTPDILPVSGFRVVN